MNAKKAAIVGVLVLFVGYWMMNDPGGLADVTKDGFSGGKDLVTQAFEGIIEFFDQL